MSYLTENLHEKPWSAIIKSLQVTRTGKHLRNFRKSSLNSFRHLETRGFEACVIKTFASSREKFVLDFGILKNRQKRTKPLHVPQISTNCKIFTLWLRKNP